MYAVVDESRMVQQPRPRPLVGALGVEQPVGQIQPIQPRVETVSTTAATLQSSDARRRANSEKDTLNRSIVEAFKPKRKRPASWPSTNEPRILVALKPSKTVDQELGRVYDSVALPKTQPKEGAVEGLEYNRLSYKGYPKKKLTSPSLDMLPLSSMYSRLNTNNDPFHTSPNSKLSASAHSVLDMDEKREANPGKKAIVPKETVEQIQQDHTMKEDDVTSSTLYSNVNGNMHPVLSKQNRSPPVYSVPDMNKKREGRQIKKIKHDDLKQTQQMRELPPQNEEHTSSPLYSNVADEMSQLQGASTPVYSVPDVEKKWEIHQVKEQSDGGSMTRAQQAKELQTRHKTFSSSPLYSNLAEEMGSVPTTPIYSVPDMEKKRKGRQAKSDKGSKNMAEQAHQAFPMKELPSRNRALTSDSTPQALYSNVNSEMHTMQGSLNQPTPMYSVPDINKKRQERLARIKEGQCIQRNASSPSLPPAPSQDIIDSMNGQSSTFDNPELEPMYPHVSVPSYLKRVKPMPSDTVNEAADMAHLYDYPRRKDIYKPIPLEGHYDFPTSNPQQAFTDDNVLHYDVPNSLSLIERSGTATQGQMTGYEKEKERLEHRGKTKRK